MNLKQQIDQDLISALKSKDELKSSVLRMVKSSIKNKEIALRQAPSKILGTSQGGTPNELDDPTIIDVLSKEIKQRKDSIEQYQSGNRPELAEKEKKEIDIILEYLPEQMSEDKITKIIKDAITKSGASNMADMGKVMGIIMPEFKGKADGTLVSKIVKEKLSK